MISGPRPRPGRRRWLRAVGREDEADTDGSAAARALYQDRLGLQHQLSFWMGVGFLTLGNLFFTLHPTYGWRGVFLTASAAFHAVGALIDLGLWLWLRRTSLRLSLGVLSVIDVGGQALFMGAISSLFYEDPRFDRPDFGLLLVLFYQLTARAIVVPSTVARTLLVGITCSIPVLWVSYVVAGTFPNPEGAPLQIIWLSYTALWCVCGTILTTAAARIIYGLRQKVSEARRLGQYTLQEKLGEGGMGTVYRARHAMLRRPTAIKLLLPEKSGPESLVRFEREVQLTASLTHPNTVAIFDYGRTPEGIFYYAMEYLDGVDLERVVKTDGPQPEARVVHWLVQVLGALSEAHSVGLVHRDIKPANIMVCRRGGELDVVKVVDFGLVKAVEQPGDPLATQAHQFVGTPGYLAPETIDAPELASALSDIYAVGAVAYRLLSGTHVFEGSGLVQLCAQHLHSRPEPPSLRLGRALHPGLEALVLRCLEKQPSLRPSSASELRSALLALDVPRWTERDAAEWWQRVNLNDLTGSGATTTSTMPSTISPSIELRVIDLARDA